MESDDKTVTPLGRAVRVFAQRRADSMQEMSDGLCIRYDEAMTFGQRYTGKATIAVFAGGIGGSLQILYSLEHESKKISASYWQYLDEQTQPVKE